MLKNLMITLLLAAPFAVGLTIALRELDATYLISLLFSAIFFAVFGWIGAVLEDRRKYGPGSPSGSSEEADRPEEASGGALAA